MSFTVKPVRKKPVIIVVLIVVSALVLINIGTALQTAATGARRAKAQTDALVICQSIQSYHDEYGSFPIIDKNSAEQPWSTLHKVLAGKPDELAPQLNSRKIVFLSFAHVGENLPLDPYGHPYHVAMDVAGTGSVIVGGIVRSGSILVWSNGPNRTNDWSSGDDIMVAK